MKRKDFLKLSSASFFLAGLKSHGINPSDLNLNYDYSENNSIKSDNKSVDYESNDNDVDQNNNNYLNL